MAGLYDVLEIREDPQWIDETFALPIMIQMTKAMCRNTGYSGYIADRINQKCLYVSENIQNWFGMSSEVFLSLGNKEYSKFMLDEELKKMKEVNSKMNTFFTKIPSSERQNHTLSFDAHILLKGDNHLAHYNISPLSFTKDGRMKLYLCLVSLSAQNDFGNVEISKEGSDVKFVYSFVNHKWNETKIMKLSSTERDILLLSASGASAEEVGKQLFKSISAVKACKQKTFKKMGVDSIAQALTKARNWNLI